jgi:hypothetical protein
VAAVKTTVVHVNNQFGYDVYIGRAVPRAGFQASKWRNPFRVKAGVDRSAAVDAYRLWFSSQKDLLAALPELRGKVLGCWCKPAACHGDVLAEFADTLPEPAS